MNGGIAVNTPTEEGARPATSLVEGEEEDMDEETMALAKTCSKLLDQEILLDIYHHMFGQVDIDSFAIEDGEHSGDEDSLSDSHSSDTSETIPIAVKGLAAIDDDADDATMPDRRLLGEIPAPVRAALYTRLCSWLREVCRVALLLDKDAASMLRWGKRPRTKEIRDFAVLQAISLTNKRHFP